MKKITINNVTIHTPWLSRKEAAEYLGISDATFARLNKALPCPHGGLVTCAKYHAQVLTSWFETLNNKG